jgi:parvulin-like peptidyl-prolyl isomerase
MKRHHFGILCLVVSLAASATMSADTVERIVAKVNGDIITLTELDEEVEVAMQQLGPAASEEEAAQRARQIRAQVLSTMIDNMLVLQVAADRGLRVPSRFFDEWKANIMTEMKIDSEEEFVRQVELQGGTVESLKKRFEEGLLLQEVRRMEVENKVSVSEPEIEERYRLHIEDYTTPPGVRLREIVVRFDETNEIEQGQKARRLLQDIEQGADFAEVARMHSDSGSRDAGGDLGFFNEGELTEALAAVAFQLGPGEMSEIIRLDTAFYIIRVEERVEAATKALADVRNEVADAIFQEKMTLQMERFVKQIRERAIIENKL